MESYEEIYDQWYDAMVKQRDEIAEAFSYLFGDKVNVNGETYTIIGIDVKPVSSELHHEMLKTASDIDHGRKYSVSFNSEIRFALAKSFTDAMWVTFSELKEVLWK